MKSQMTEYGNTLQKTLDFLKIPEHAAETLMTLVLEEAKCGECATADRESLLNDGAQTMQC